MSARDLPPVHPHGGLNADAHSRPMKVGIVGAGIGGLMAAITLLDNGHEVEIFEKSRFSKEVGAAISTPPNSSRILAHHGFDFDRSNATTSDYLIYYDDPKDLTQMIRLPMSGYESEFGAPWYLFHRVDLHDELRRMATEPSPARPRVARLHLGTAVSSIDLHGTIHFSDGTSTRKDVVIAADGIRSSFSSAVLDNVPPLEHFASMIRLLLPTEKMPQDAETNLLFGDGLNSVRAMRAGDGCHSVVMYGCRRGALQNIAFMYPEEISKDHSGMASVITRSTCSKISPGNGASKDEGFLQMVADIFPPSIHQMASEAEGVGHWNLYKRRPLESFARGRVVLIGDAAHPMPPLRAQGASMAIEDAAALGVLFSDKSSVDEVPERLQLFNQLRVKRAATIQIISSQHKWDSTKVPAEYLHYFDGKVPREIP
ncbi:3-hydroxybenzoate 6-hydroxylase 1 [Colletotrichum trifolii]|uniref:3-hydroxybenzoate 6-hydroxylase 1 n=1 Tax=Colletotrichum trifolii TaxID=5466 RepID=A0A4R8RRJ4_COLTR|nr:3-hydroxybenzoate 6-hydroxylase 1 [Colletotrichum trifolii]